MGVLKFPAAADALQVPLPCLILLQCLEEPLSHHQFFLNGKGKQDKREWFWLHITAPVQTQKALHSVFKQPKFKPSIRTGRAKKRKGQMCWTDSPAEPFLMFTEKSLEKRKHPVSCSSVGEHARGQSRIVRLFELIERK